MAKGIMKIIPAEFKRMINYFEEIPYQNKRPMLESRQNVSNIFILNINKTQEHTTNLIDLLNVVLYNDNFKMPNQVWEETLLALDNDLDEYVLERLYERQVKKSTFIKNAMPSKHQDILFLKHP